MLQKELYVARRVFVNAGNEVINGLRDAARGPCSAFDVDGRRTLSRVL
jgi:hypothetical protein